MHGQLLLIPRVGSESLLNDNDNEAAYFGVIGG